MQFKDKIEIAVLPLIDELRQTLASVPTVALFNHYQLKHHLSQFGTAKFPDGFWTKWRYLWALRVALKFSAIEDVRPNEQVFKSIDELIEKIFDVYSFGAIYEPGQAPASEKEFLTRLGLGLSVREPDALGFPEQIENWALERFKPFNNSYFLPVFGIPVEEIFQWVNALIRDVEVKLNAWVGDMVSIFSDIDGLRKQFITGTLSLQEIRDGGDQLKIRERLKRNEHVAAALHVLSKEEIQAGIPHASFDLLMELLTIKSEQITPDFVFPHQENPLDYKLFLALPIEDFYFVDPASAHRILAKIFERKLTSNTKLRERYLLKRSRAMERLVEESVKRTLPSAEIYHNYYLEKGSKEKDIFVRYGNIIILIECKNSRVRVFSGQADDLVKYESDFKDSAQYAYEQADEVKRQILEHDETIFIDSKWQPYFSIKKRDVDRIYIVCITVSPRGLFGTDLSYELKKREGEPFSLAMGLFDFETICSHFNSGQFAGYLAAREGLHGRVRSGDELNYAGYFFKFGNLDLEDHTFLADDFSSVFDRNWYRQRGLEIDEPSDGPVFTSMERKGNKVRIEHGNGKREVIKLPSWVIERTVGKSPIKMKGADRNELCPCGSGLKLKNCCGVS